MKIKVGSRLQAFREEHKMTQAEIADVLSLSPSAYARLERGETQADFEEVVRFAETLNVPLHEFLPDTVTFHNHNNGRGAGVIFGNYIVNMGTSESIKMLETENGNLLSEIENLKSKIAMLEQQIEQGSSNESQKP